jgi:hypothetical protein
MHLIQIYQVDKRYQEKTLPKQLMPYVLETKYYLIEKGSSDGSSEV